MHPTNRITDPRRRIFLVNGRDHQAVEEIGKIASALGLHIITFDDACRETGQPSPMVWDAVRKGFQLARAAVVLFTPDEEARLHLHWSSSSDVRNRTSDLEAQARPNVLVEAGVALGQQLKRTVLVQIGDKREISDFSGRHYLSLRTQDSVKAFADRLKNAGCKVVRSRGYRTSANLDRLWQRTYVRFDYYPDSPYDHRWTKAGNGHNLQWRRDPHLGQVVCFEGDGHSASDYNISKKLFLRQLSFCVKPGSQASVYARLDLHGTRTPGWLKYEFPTHRIHKINDTEYAYPFDTEDLPGDWTRCSVDIDKAASKTFASDGKTVDALAGVRVRGSVTLALVSFV